MVLAKTKGQTSLEYLLIVVVAIVVVVAVMVWMNATTKSSVGTASHSVNFGLCMQQSCTTEAPVSVECLNIPVCSDLLSDGYIVACEKREPMNMCKPYKP
jgi:ABC-type sugar transport system permease subunit